MNQLNQWLGGLFVLLGIVTLAIWGWLTWSASAPPPPENNAIAVSTPVLIDAAPVQSGILTPIPVLTNTPNAEGTIEPLPTTPPTPSLTPTSKPQPVVEMATFIPPFEVAVLDATAVPTAELPDQTINVLLIGTDDRAEGDAAGTERTDTIIVASVNIESATAAMMSIPRDLFVAIPGWKTERINTAYAHGNAVGYPGGGVQLLKDTILYNFGIPIHFYAQIDFDGFTSLIDAVGGITVVNTCEITDWRLKAQGLDITVEDNYELVTLPAGVYDMNGFEALWYARSRKGSSDFDRGRRQQQVLRAMADQAVNANLLPQVPQLWSAYRETVETDLDIGRAFQLAGLAGSIPPESIRTITLLNGSTQYAAGPDGVDQLVLVPEIANFTVQQLINHDLTPFDQTQANITAHLINRSGNPDNTAIAIERLQSIGVEVILIETAEEVPYNQIALSNMELASSSVQAMGRILGISPEEGDPQSTADVTITLGKSFSGCGP